MKCFLSRRLANEMLPQLETQAHREGGHTQIVSVACVGSFSSIYMQKIQDDIVTLPFSLFTARYHLRVPGIDFCFLYNQISNFSSISFLFFWQEWGWGLKVSGELKIKIFTDYRSIEIISLETMKNNINNIHIIFYQVVSR